MSTPIQLATGLGGAIGSDYVLSRNEVYFVEFNNGKVSVLDLVRPLDTIVFSGTATMPADSSLRLINGTVTPTPTNGELYWEHTGPRGTLVMKATGNGSLSYVGVADFDSITQAELQNLTYSQNDLPGNKLTNGTVFGLLNSYPQPGFNYDYAKFKVINNAGGSIQLKWVLYHLKPRYHFIGSGYTQPEDIKVTSGGRYAYVTERSGNFLRVDLTNADHAAAHLVASGLVAPHQIALDEAHGQAYVPEFTTTASGRLWRIDLSGGLKTAVFTGLQGCTGLLVTKDLAYAYVAEQVGGANRLRRINLATGHTDVLITSLTAPFFMKWADASESLIILTERNAANRVTMLDLSVTPVTATVLVSSVPNLPSSVVLNKPGTLIVCSDAEINQYDLSDAFFSLAGPLFMGIGLVPVDHITNATPPDDNTDGYANTLDIAAGYLLRVKDAPFGGALAIMVNHNAALLAGATSYRLFVRQVTPAAGPMLEPRQGFSDYLWDAASNSFIPQTTGPDAGGFYPVRKPYQIWYNPLLGYMLDTSILSNGLCLIDIKLYNAAKVEIPVSSFHSRRVKIDNQWPVATIEKIFHDGVEVPVCDIVNHGTDQFTFRITATDPQGHMLAWSLGVLWGDNKSATICGDEYYNPPAGHNHASPTRQWAGVVPTGLPAGDVPAGSVWHAAYPEFPGRPGLLGSPTNPVDPTSTHCAHTFYLSAWDRVINGYGYIHGSSYHKSITIWLP